MAKPNTKMCDYLEYDVGLPRSGAAANPDRGFGTASVLSRAGVTTYDTVGTVQVNSYNGRYQSSAGTISTNTETMYLRTGANVNNRIIISYRIPLKQFTNTIFALDKVIYANEILVFRLAMPNLDLVLLFKTIQQILLQLMLELVFSSKISHFI